MKTPDEIFLQIDNGDDMPVSWCKDQIYDTDIPYVLRSTNERLKKQLSRVIDEYQEILKYHEIECCQNCSDYMVESKNCIFDTVFGCTNWRGE